MYDRLKSNVLSDTLSSVKFITVSFLLIHFILLLLMLYDMKLIMVTVETVSVLIYIKNWFRLDKYPKNVNDVTMYDKVNNDIVSVSSITCIELLIHMGIAIIMCGLDCNFQHHIYGVFILIMFANYIRNDNHKYRLMSVFAILIYLDCRIMLAASGSIYDKVECESVLSVVNPVLVIIFISYFLLFVTNLMIKFEKSLLFGATHDALTELPNRYLLDGLVYTSNSYIAIMDIDKFKTVNDTYGHDVGDVVLQSLSKIIRETCISNPGLQAMRWGGEEFVFVYTNEKATKEQFIEILSTFKNKVSNDTIQLKLKESFNYNITIGISDYTEGKDLEEMLKVADERLYVGKKTGRNKIVTS